MRIVQTVFGVFHHFDLARQLQRQGYLEKIFSTWPWKRLQREGLPHDKVETFPWIHTPEYVLRRYGMLPQWLDDASGYANALTFDAYTARRIPGCDALIALSGSSLKTGQLVQQRGGKFVCDRGSSHQRFQGQIVQEEYARWNVTLPPNDERDTAREEAIYDVADAITVPSTFAARSFLQMGVSAEKLQVIPYGVELDEFKPVTKPAQGQIDLLYAGAVSLRKGFPYLLDAFARLKHPHKRLRVAGAVTREMEAVLPKLPKENVEFLGPIPRAELVRYMSSSHLMVLPSIEEGLALVQGQAMACGCPVLASTNTGSEDLYTDGVEGFIVPIRNPDALLERMQQIADDPFLQQTMSHAALERVKQLGGWKEYGDQWGAFLRTLTGKQ